ncbi:MAG: hypothetical protein AVDCRST_MAG58-825, partial [uncultured Rubrobacteraceae bacterium]
AARRRVRRFRALVHEVGQVASAGRGDDVRQDAVAWGTALQRAPDHEQHKRRARGYQAQHHGVGRRVGRRRVGQAEAPPYGPAGHRHRDDREGRADHGQYLRRTPRRRGRAVRGVGRGRPEGAHPHARRPARGVEARRYLRL